MPAPVSPVAGAIRLAAGTAAFSALLFLSAGTVRWPAAWAYLAIVTAVMVAYAAIVARLHPDLIEERLHPGYAGSMLYMIGLTVALGSRVALGPAALLGVVLGVRTALEDRTLHEELDGYAAYARRVRFRILPGIW